MFFVPWLVGCCLRLRNPVSLRNRVSLYLTLLEKSYNAFWGILEAEPPDVRSQAEPGNEIESLYFPHHRLAIFNFANQHYIRDAYE
jgi:hypothetical protein